MDYQLSLFADSNSGTQQTAIADRISDLLQIVKNRMYREEYLKNEIAAIETALMKASDQSDIKPENLLAAAREWIVTRPNLSAIQAIGFAAGVDFS